MKKVGIYSGSYNPVHNGHTSLAHHLLVHTDLDEIWMIVSPQNPLKKYTDLLEDNARWEMLQLALADEEKIIPSDVELNLPKPSFTVNTLRHLAQKHPDVEFSLIIGADNLACFHKWREYDYILEHFSLIVYPRTGYQIDENWKAIPTIKIADAPLFNVSSTLIRNLISEGKNVQGLINERVLDYIKKNNLYQ